MCSSKVYNGVKCDMFWFDTVQSECVLASVSDKSALFDHRELNPSSGIVCFEVRVLNVKKGLS